MATFVQNFIDFKYQLDLFFVVFARALLVSALLVASDQALCAALRAFCMPRQLLQRVSCVGVLFAAGDTNSARRVCPSRRKRRFDLFGRHVCRVLDEPSPAPEYCNLCSCRRRSAICLSSSGSQVKNGVPRSTYFLCACCCAFTFCTHNVIAKHLVCAVLLHSLGLHGSGNGERLCAGSATHATSNSM